MRDTHKKIINAARELFSTKGYAATTTKDIASSAGISEVTLFRHFESKRNLFLVSLHSTLEDTMLLNFFENELTYDLDIDLKKLAHYLHIIHRDNGPMLKMMIKDKEVNSFEEITKPKIEKKIKKYSNDYFEKLYEMGKISDDPVMCRKFFFHNAIGFLMRKFVMEKCDDGIEYYDWMIEKTINAIKIDKTNNQERTTHGKII